VEELVRRFNGITERLIPYVMAFSLMIVSHEYALDYELRTGMAEGIAAVVYLGFSQLLEAYLPRLKELNSNTPSIIFFFWFLSSILYVHKEYVFQQQPNE
jgi:hypothetical protein